MEIEVKESKCERITFTSRKETHPLETLNQLIPQKTISEAAGNELRSTTHLAETHFH